MIYNVTINDKVYEVEVEKGKANLLRTTDVVAAPAPVAAAPVAAAPAATPAPAAAPAVAVSGTPATAPMPGTILDVKVSVGQAVKEGDVVAILEAMKMENEIFAPCDGKVAQVCAAKGSSVATGDPIITIG